MKVVKRMISIIILLLFLSACGGIPSENSVQEKNWQDYYDLGIRYLSEGNYEEAIIAFTAAIEIDPKQAVAYIGRGDAYRALAEAIDAASDGKEREDFLGHAADDYKMAIDLDGTTPETYRKLAEIYIALNDNKAAIAILDRGLRTTNDEDIEELLDDMKESMGRPWGVSIDTLTPEQQEFVYGLIGVVEQEDKETAWEIVKEVEEALMGMCIETERYRLSFTGMHGSLGGSVEIRSDDGVGYYCHCDYNETHLRQEFGTGQCKNWNWNGAYSKYEHYTLFGDIEYTNQIAGTMKGSFLNGEITTSCVYTYLETGRVSESIRIDEYVDGIMVNSDDDSPYAYSAWYECQKDYADWSGYYDEHGIYITE